MKMTCPDCSGNHSALDCPQASQKLADVGKRMEIDQSGVTVRFVGDSVGQCGTCFNRERTLMDQICEPCWTRQLNAEAEKIVKASDELLGFAPAAAGPVEANPERIVARMSITLAADGNVTVTGPLEQRAVIVQMVLGALDISYEVAKAAQQRAQIAAAPQPKKWSAAWFAQEFARKRLAKQLREASGKAASG